MSSSSVIVHTFFLCLLFFLLSDFHEIAQTFFTFFLTVSFLCRFFLLSFHFDFSVKNRAGMQKLSTNCLRTAAAKIKISQNALHRFHFPIVQCARVGRHITLLQRKTERDRNSTTSRDDCHAVISKVRNLKVRKKTEVESRFLFFPRASSRLVLERRALHGNTESPTERRVTERRSMPRQESAQK